MPHPIQKIFYPLYWLAHQPDSVRYHQRMNEFFLDAIFQRVQLPPDASALEIGCGDGSIANALGARCRWVVGFDINPNRIGHSQRDNVLLVLASAELPPVPPARVDLVLSFSVLEHLVDPVVKLQQLATLLKPDGVMVHLMPTPSWKFLQWLLFFPSAVRKHLRALTRGLAGQRKVKRASAHPGFESNNPYRAKRRRWYTRLYPRVHGEFDSNWKEFKGFSEQAWRKRFDAAGLELVEVIGLGMHSPYGFGVSALTRWWPWGSTASCKAYVLKPRT